MVPGAGHLLLQEPGVSLVQLLQCEGFYQTSREFTTPWPKGGVEALGPAAPVERPSAEVGGVRGWVYMGVGMKGCTQVNP